MTETPPADADGEPTDDSERGRLAALTSGLTAGRAALYALLAGLVVFYLSPLEAGLMTAFKTTDAFTHTAPIAPPGPGGFTTEPWKTAFATLKSGLINSVILAVPAAALSALFGSLAAYGLTNLKWRGQVPIVLLFVAGIFIPYQAVLVPLSRFFAIVNTQQLLEPLWGLPLMEPYYASLVNLIITHTAYGIPLTMLLFRSYYKNFSTEMLEAARLDGATAYTIYRRIILPLSVPMFAVTLIYQFTQIWNDLLFALIIIPSGSGQAAVVTLKLNELTGGIVQTFNTQMAGAFVAAIPTLIVYVLFGDKFARGVAGQ
ncbi:carbohydrate ABC transporter permease [Halocalculus aciditolerans]|uniref:ABC transporter permease n=1 Tax=Halocalculus aciditolerans TaxID=1383812 RepID=A0A830FAR5_9EURY|nr:carbohydrate ABC transporter permease [Halocalculus aciditolerans]GGL56449.1 ABC transporter permease [Halocalculus aciditolerans]